MGGAIEVRLRDDAVPVFPAACCVCLAERPGDRHIVKARRASYWEVLMPWLWFTGKRVRHEVAMCPACRRREIWRRRWQWLGFGVAIAATLVVWQQCFEPSRLPRAVRRLVQLGLFLAFALPVGFWFVFWPLAFDLTVGDGYVAFEFANAEYAARFRRANDGALLPRA